MLTERTRRTFDDNQRKRGAALRWFAATMLLWLGAMTAMTETASAQAGVSIATAVRVSQTATAQLGGSQVTVVDGSQLFEGQSISTNASGEVQIVFADETRMVIGPNSTLVIERYLMRDPNTVSELAVNALGGTFRFISGNSPSESYTINTPTGTIGVRGTALDFLVDWITGVVDVIVYEGNVFLTSALGDIARLNESCDVGSILSTADAELIEGFLAENGNVPFMISETNLRSDFVLEGAEDCFEELTAEDRDGDSITDRNDNCPDIYNPTQRDTDDDDIGDACDSVIDIDDDGIADTDDNCPRDPNPDQADIDGDGAGDACDRFPDMDDDGVEDSADNCPTDANSNQADSDHDGIGNVCDPIEDSDGDGIEDNDDNCPSDANPGQQDTDNDNIGDACDSLTDRDDDGIADDDDNCPTDANPGQTDTDDDGIGDACDSLNDSDNDGIADDDDNCPYDHNPGQADSDDDGIGNACDDFNDNDEDGIANGNDNCPNTPNPGQEDADNDGIGTACDDFEEEEDDEECGGECECGICEEGCCPCEYSEKLG